MVLEPPRTVIAEDEDKYDCNLSLPEWLDHCWVVVINLPPLTIGQSRATTILEVQPSTTAYHLHDAVVTQADKILDYNRWEMYSTYKGHVYQYDDVPLHSLGMHHFCSVDVFIGEVYVVVIDAPIVDHHWTVDVAIGDSSTVQELIQDAVAKLQHEVERRGLPQPDVDSLTLMHGAVNLYAHHRRARQAQLLCKIV